MDLTQRAINVQQNIRVIDGAFPIHTVNVYGLPVRNARQDSLITNKAT
jgi:hypothetical protein